MDDPYALDRRGFLRTGAVAAAASVVGCGSPGRWRVLTDTEAETLAAACDQIVPPDADPGAAEVGAVDFIDRQLATRHRDRLGFWQQGLAGLDSAAVRREGARFHALAFERRTVLLQAIEAGEMEGEGWGDAEPRAFFGALVSFTMMGFYGDPRHGGNRERVSWRMLGLPDPPVRGRHTEPDESRG